MNYLRQLIKTSILVVPLLLAASPNQAIAQDSLINFEQAEQPPTMDELLKWKEVFTYEVRYSFFKLGEVQTTIVTDTTYNGKKVWWLRTIITSSPGIPFVGKEENHYNTFMVETDSMPYTQLYWRDNVDEQQFRAEEYIYDYTEEKVYFSKDGEPVDTLALTEPSSSGQLIFYYSRLFAGTNKNYRLPVYLKGEKGYINGTNSTEMEMREYKAFDRAVKTYYSKGDADIDGPFGFTGNYEAWYIADKLRVPAEARAKVWLGNVKVKLIDYKKERRDL
ncbi:DUF3108 domain-containing protein [Aliifodinibius halophilus]|uniref:DUF3108 domain-containing protein n=1 Tax=Fodinibius halophilus TaxID=1736908 RepID=A0A6M1SXD8_9BACT|nr:DUF3108 domain-containing protein [Fodinibius halophilus]